MKTLEQVSGRQVIGWLYRIFRTLVKRGWKFLRLELVIITTLAVFAGFIWGAVRTYGEMDSFDEYQEYEEKIEWLLYDAQI